MGVAGAAAVLFFSLLPKPLMLLDRAKPYPNSRGLLEFGFDYFWLSDHEILFKGRRPRRSYTIFDDWVTRMDLRTMKEVPTAPLNKLIIKEVLELKGGPDHLNISPDGKWMLWSTLVSAYSQNPPGKVVHIATAMGSRDYRWLDTDKASQQQHFIYHDCNMIWHGDSKGWTEFHTGGGQVPYSLKNYSIGSPIQSPWITLGSSGMYMTVLGEMPDGRIIALDKNRRHPKPSTELLKTYRAESGSKPEQVEFVIPPNCIDWGSILSPQGDQIAWVFANINNDNAAGPLGKFYKLLGREERPWVGLWTSKTDGSDLREVGHINAGAGSRAAGIWALYNDFNAALVRWLPDGKNLSFVYKHRLYTVPVNK